VASSDGGPAAAAEAAPGAGVEPAAGGGGAAGADGTVTAQAPEPNPWDGVRDHPQAPAPGSIHITDWRRIHILDGDGTGVDGGHAPGTGIPGKTEFPANWTDDRIINAIVDVAQRPQTILGLQDNNRWLVMGVRDGVVIHVVVQSDGQVWTGFPISGPGVVRNE
jgi:hypothetical protein